MAKLSDKQRKKIIAEYVAGDGKITQEQLAKKYAVSRQAIMPKEDERGNIHSEQNGRFVSKGGTEDKLTEVEPEET